MKTQFMILGAALATLATASAAVTERDLCGIWKYEKSALIGGAALFTSLRADGTCTQVARGRAFGMTKWAVYSCIWIVENSDLKITILEAPDQPTANGRTIMFNILRADSARLRLASDGERLEWNAVASLPPEFQEKLDAGKLGVQSAAQ